MRGVTITVRVFVVFYRVTALSVEGRSWIFRYGVHVSLARSKKDYTDRENGGLGHRQGCMTIVLTRD